ncbi:ankyrin repeat-containing domain protein [Aspergillus pseudoustus]|uniref:Ankyrin repeat-containing domain protein n=1 Tax=Aspergillus pseudoustus TaxID=1810923 RepID=A0ABR4KYJ1_9EURO
MAQLLNLPNEVLLLVAEKGETQHDISSFAQSNRRLYDLVHPYLCAENVRHHNSSAVIWAVNNGQTRLLTQLREGGADLCTFEPKQKGLGHGSVCPGTPQNPLLLAAQGSRIEVFKLLLSWPVPRSLLHVAFHWSIRQVNTELVEMMIRNGVSLEPDGANGSSALGVAVGKGSIPIITRLLEAGARIHPEEIPRLFLIALRTLPIFQLLLESGNIPIDDEPLFHAAADNNIPGLQLLIDYGFNIEVYGNHSLFYAVEQGSADAVRLLIDKGANPHLPCQKSVKPDRADLTLSKRMKYREAISLLSPFSFEAISGKESIDDFTLRRELELLNIYPETNVNYPMPFVFKSHN